jgi:probable phosphoglycerate mutase
MKSIYLARHGEAKDDIQGLYGGSSDHEPTERGLEEAKEFAESFKDKRIEVIISSHYKRAANPAKIISDILNIHVEFDKDLRECDRYGILTGMNKQEAREKYPETVAAIENDDSVEGSEPLEDFKKRVFTTLEKIWNRQEQNILVLTHGGFIRFALGVHWKQFEMGHYGWVKVTKENNSWKTLDKHSLQIP